MASRSFSEPRNQRTAARRTTALRRGLRVVALAALPSVVAACQTVRPEDKEHLADPAMTFGGDAPVAAHEEHVFGNREASFGAGGVSGGGCGCN